MTNPQLILDRLTAWVEKQSSVGPAAFRQALAEIRRDVERESKTPEAQQAELAYRLDATKQWLAKSVELRDAITEHLAVDLQCRVAPLIASAMEETVQALQMPSHGELFEGLKEGLNANPVLKRELQLWLADEPIEPLVQELGTALGEFARDELGATLADIDAAIAADKEHERVSKPKKRAAKPKARKK